MRAARLSVQVIFVSEVARSATVLHQPLIEPDDVKWRLAGQCAATVLSHRLGKAAAVGCHWHTFRELTQRNEVHASDHELDQPRAIQQLCLAGSQFFGGAKCQERAGVAQRFGAGRLIELGEIYDSACAGESIGNDHLTLTKGSRR